jgi:hypothetical protein
MCRCAIHTAKVKASGMPTEKAVKDQSIDAVDRLREIFLGIPCAMMVRRIAEMHTYGALLVRFGRLPANSFTDAAAVPTAKRQGLARAWCINTGFAQIWHTLCFKTRTYRPGVPVPARTIPSKQ